MFHGGSGSSAQEIKDSVSYGVVKMNIDTDTQWATWEGILKYYKDNEAYLQGQLGNPKGEDQPNKNTMTRACGCVPRRRAWLRVWSRPSKSLMLLMCCKSDNVNMI